MVFQLKVQRELTLMYISLYGDFSGFLRQMPLAYLWYVWISAYILQTALYTKDQFSSNIALSRDQNAYCILQIQLYCDVDQITPWQIQAMLIS